MRAHAALSMVAVSACGRLGFDPTSGPTDDDDSSSVFISPSGSDDSPGTRAAPFKTFSAALAATGPGITLVLLDGTYGQATGTGDLIVDCEAPSATCGGGPCPNGRADARITVRADRSRQATIQGTDYSPLWLKNCSFWDFHGLVVHNTDALIPIRGNTITLDEGTDLVLRDLIVTKPNRFENWNAIEISDCDRVLLEDSEVYDFHEHGVAVYYSGDVVVRRVYANGRGRLDGPGSTTCPSEGDLGFSIRNSANVLVESSIAENNCEGFEIIVGDSVEAGRRANAGNDNRIVSSVAIGKAGIADTGFAIIAQCTGGCSEKDIPDRNLIKHAVALGFERAFLGRGRDSEFEMITAIGSDTGIELDADTSAFPDGSGRVTGASLVGVEPDPATTRGVNVSADVAAWSVTTSNAFLFDTAWVPATNVVTSTQQDPMFGACTMYSRFDGFGARVMTRWVNGVDSGMALWDEATGAFPCGAVVVGVNDDSNVSCTGVHERISVTSCLP
ncbi:MAG: right-handed parallel beta-helix repeat-containing protein [Kofleriaceae bacterium]